MEMIYTVFSPLLTLKWYLFGNFLSWLIYGTISPIKKDKTMKYWKVLVASAMVFTLSSCGGGGDGNDAGDGTAHGDNAAMLVFL